MSAGAGRAARFLRARTLRRCEPCLLRPAAAAAAASCTAPDVARRRSTPPPPTAFSPPLQPTPSPLRAPQVNTLIRPDGQKKAYVKLTSDFDALDVANRIGII